MAALILVDLIAAALWLTLLTRLDAYRTQKRQVRINALFYLFGLLSALPVLALGELLGSLSFGNMGVILAYGFFFIIVVGPVEEFSKFLAFLLPSLKLRSIREPLDGVLQAASVGLGFASAENFLFGLEGGARLVVLRSFLVTTVHVVYTALWGGITSMAVLSSTRRDGRVGLWELLLSRPGSSCPINHCTSV